MSATKRPAEGASAGPSKRPGTVGGLALSPMVDRISESKTIQIQSLSKQLQEQGHKINAALCVGEPGYAPPPAVVSALRHAARDGHTHYTVVQGTAELRQSVCDDLKARKGVQYKPNQVLISNGGKQAIYQACLAVLGEGDEMLVPTPCWVSYHDIARLCRATPVSVETKASEGYILKPDVLEAALAASGSRCRMVVICSPCNPTGAVIPPATLEALAEVLRRPQFAHVYVLADEIYERITYGTEHVCFASLPGMHQRTLLINGFSKGYAMTGLRLGYLATAHDGVARAVVKLQGQITSCASSATQQAALGGLRGGQEVEAWMRDRVRELREKRDFVLGRLRSLRGVECETPEGAFYVLPDLSKVFGAKGAKVATSEEFCKLMLREYQVALVPGEAFHALGTVRLSYACEMIDLEAAVEAFTKCVGALVDPQTPLADASPRAGSAPAARRAGDNDAGASGNGDGLVLGSLVGTISESKTIQIQSLSKQLEEQGHKINGALCVGEPGYAPPPVVVDALGAAAWEGHTHYTVVQGTTELRQAICNDLKARKGVEYKPSQVLVACGGKQAIYQACLAVLDEGDEMLVPTPCWVSYHDIARLCRATPVSVETKASEGYILKPDTLLAALQASGPRCRMIVICSPCNPTGAVIPPATLAALADVLRRPEFAHIYVLADEIYERITYSTEHVCFASLPGMRERTLLINGFSKAYAMTGLRLGYLAAAHDAVAAAAVKLQGQITSCASSVTQHAALAGLRGGAVVEVWMGDRVRELREKRDFVLSQLRRLADVQCATPEGAFYVLPDLSKVLGTPGAKAATSEEFCNILLREHQVALVPGEAFHAPGTVRISYACDMADLKAAVEAFVKCVVGLRPRG